MQDLRDSMKVSSDPRAARTREAIIAAMHELTAASDAPLTVSAIVNKAQISRSSFYAQFASLDELGLATLRAALAEIAAAGDLLYGTTKVSPAVARAAIERLVAHVDENRLLYRSVLALPVSYEVYREAVTTLEAQLREVIPLIAKHDRHVDISVAATYMASGTIAVLSNWLRNRPSDSREDVTEQLMALVPSWVIAPVAESGGATKVVGGRAKSSRKL